MKKDMGRIFLTAALRITMGWLLLWAFLDKLFGWGYATAPEKAWLLGTSPTEGFLKMGTSGPFAGVYQSMAGSAVVDWLFMLGLLCIGLALILGIGMRIAAWTGALLMLLMFFAVLPLAHNPILDEHIIYAIVLLLLPRIEAGNAFGFGEAWSKMKFVKKYPFLQ